MKTPGSEASGISEARPVRYKLLDHSTALAVNLPDRRLGTVESGAPLKDGLTCG